MKEGSMLVLALFVPVLLLRGQAASEPVAPLTISIVHSEEQNDTEYFSSDEFPDLGYVGSQPDLVAEQFAAVIPSVSFERIVNPISGATKEVPRYGVSVKFIEEDKRRFSFLTKHHQGSHFLIKVTGKPVYAPTVRIPLTHGWMEIAAESNADAESLAEELLPFVRKDVNQDLETDFALPELLEP